MTEDVAKKVLISKAASYRMNRPDLADVLPQNFKAALTFLLYYGQLGLSKGGVGGAQWAQGRCPPEAQNMTDCDGASE